MDELDKKLGELFENNYNITQDCDVVIAETLSKLKSENQKLLRYKILKMVAMLVLVLGVTTASAYIGEKIYNKYFIDVRENSEIGFSDIEMTYDEECNFAYKIVDDEADLEKLKKLYNNIPEVDFNNQYILVIQHYSRIIDEIEIKEIYSDDTCTYVTLSNSKLAHTSSANSNIFCYTLDNSLKRNIVKIKIIPGSEDIQKYNFTVMSNIDVDYCKTTAYEENCIILDNISNVLSNNENLIYDFIERSQNGENCAIRIIKDISANFDNEDYLYKVVDVIYENNVYYYFHAVYNYDGMGYAISKSDGKEIKLEKSGETYFLLLLGETTTRVATMHLD